MLSCSCYSIQLLFLFFSPDQLNLFYSSLIRLLPFSYLSIFSQWTFLALFTAPAEATIPEAEVVGSEAESSVSVTEGGGEEGGKVIPSLSQGVLSAGKQAGEVPKLIIIIVTVIGSSLLLLNIVLVVCFLGKKKKKRLEEGQFYYLRYLLFPFSRLFLSSHFFTFSSSLIYSFPSFPFSFDFFICSICWFTTWFLHRFILSKTFTSKHNFFPILNTQVCSKVLLTFSHFILLPLSLLSSPHFLLCVWNNMMRCGVSFFSMGTIIEGNNIMNVQLCDREWRREDDRDGS